MRTTAPSAHRFDPGGLRLSRTHLTGWTFWALKPELPASPRHAVRTRRGDVQGAAMVEEPDGIEVATITIRKVLTDSDYEISYEAVDEQGDDLALIDTLGLLEFAKVSVIADWAADPAEDDE